MSNLPTMPSLGDGATKKSFWQRPEGTTGMITMAVIGVGGFLLLKSILPTILEVLDMGISAVGKGITLTVLGVVLFILVKIVTSSKVHALVSAMFKSVMRNITAWFITIDPIGIMQNYIDTLRGKKKMIDEGISKLNGQIRICQNKILENKGKANDAMAIVAEAKKRDMKSAMTVNSRQAERMEKLTKETYEPMLNTMQMHLRALRKYSEVTTAVVEDLTNEVVAQKDKREMITNVYGTVQMIKSILNGDGDQRELFDQSLEYLVHDFGMKTGEIENFMEVSRPFIDKLDIQNGVYEANALARLQEWEQKADSILLGDTKRQMLEDQNAQSPITMAVGREPVTLDGDYQKFLN